MNKRILAFLLIFLLSLNSNNSLIFAKNLFEDTDIIEKIIEEDITKKVSENEDLILLSEDFSNGLSSWVVSSDDNVKLTWHEKGNYMVQAENGGAIYKDISNLLKPNTTYELMLRADVSRGFDSIIQVSTTPQSLILEAYKSAEMEEETFLFTTRDEVHNIILSLISNMDGWAAYYYVEIREESSNKENPMLQAKMLKNSAIFEIPGKGNVDTIRNNQRKRFAFNPYEPTGLVVRQDEQIEIFVHGTNTIYAAIENHVYRGNATPRKIPLSLGSNIITAPRYGVLYFINENNGANVTVEVTGGQSIPLFILGKHNADDWNFMLDNYTLVNYPIINLVELKGDRVLISLTRETAEKYLRGKDPSVILKLHDEAVRIQDKVTGVADNFTGVNKTDTNYISFIEDKTTSAYMYASNYMTGFSTSGAQHVIDADTFKTDGWGPWHEQGHQRQQSPWLWNGLSEVTVNIYSLAVQRAFGNTSRLERDKIYERAFSYLSQPNSSKNFDALSDVFIKLVMFWQLELAFGESFYPLLHQMYREMPSNEIPYIDELKRQTFIQNASIIANRNLTPFFEQWGLTVSNETKNKISHLPSLSKQIWNGRDSKPIIEDIIPSVGIPTNLIASRETSNSIKLSWNTPSSLWGIREYYIYRNGMLIGTTSSNSYVDTEFNDLTLESYDVIAVSFYNNLSGIANVSIKGMGTIEMEDLIKSVKVNSSGGSLYNIEIETDRIYQEANYRIIVELNGSVIAESYKGVTYNASLNKGTQLNTIIIHNQTLSDSDKITVSMSAGTRGDFINKIKSISFSGAELKLKSAIKDIRIEINKNNDKLRNIYVDIDKAYQLGSNRIVLDLNGKYVSESYEGRVYYGHILKYPDYNTLAAYNLDLNESDRIKVYLSDGKPGYVLNNLGEISFTLMEKLFKDAIKDIVLIKDGYGTIFQIQVVVDKEYQKGSNRIVIDVNEQYLGESYEGVVYYGSNLKGSDTNVLRFLTSGLSSDDKIKVYLSGGAPGQKRTVLVPVTVQ